MFWTNFLDVMGFIGLYGAMVIVVAGLVYATYEVFSLLFNNDRHPAVVVLTILCAIVYFSAMIGAIMTVGNLISKSDNKQPTTQQSMTTKQLSDRLTAALEEYPEVEQSYVVIKDAQGNLYPVTSVSYDEDGVTMVADTIQNVNK